MSNSGRTSSLVAGLGTAALLVSSCGLFSDDVQELGQNLSQAAEELAESEEFENFTDALQDLGDAVDAESAALADGADVSELNSELPAEPQELDGAIHYRGLEWHFESMVVVSEGAGLMGGSGIEFTVTAVNPWDDPRGTAGDVTLQWEDSTGSIRESSTAIASQVHNPGVEIPGNNAQAPFSFTVPLSAAELESFDMDSAVLVFGNEGQSRPQFPLGSGELIPLFPVQQTDLVGEVFEVSGGILTVTVDEAELRWDIGGDDGRAPASPEGEAVLHITVTLANNLSEEGGGSFCWHRASHSANFTLVHTETNSGTRDPQMSDRGCTDIGETHTSFTGIPVREPYAGEYVITHISEFYDSEVNRQGYTEEEVELTFTMLDEAEVPMSQR